MTAYCFSNRNDVKWVQIGSNENVNFWTCSRVSDKILHFKETQKKRKIVNNFHVP